VLFNNERLTKIEIHLNRIFASYQNYNFIEMLNFDKCVDVDYDEKMLQIYVILCL